MKATPKLKTLLFPRLVFLEAEYDDAGGYALTAYVHTTRGTFAAGATDGVGQRPVAVVVCGHGAVSRAHEGETARRIVADEQTFLCTRAQGRIAFFRRERLGPLRDELARRGIVVLEWFCAGEDARLPAAGALYADMLYERIGYRSVLRPTAQGSALLQAAVRRIRIPVLGLLMTLLGCNAWLAPRLHAERERLRLQLEQRREASRMRLADDERQKALLRAFAARPQGTLPLLCDRIAAAVPEQVRLRTLEVEPPVGRFEADRPLQRRENLAVVTGGAPASAPVSVFVSRLATSQLWRSVKLVSIGRERNEAGIIFRIEIEL